MYMRTLAGPVFTKEQQSVLPTKELFYTSIFAKVPEGTEVYEDARSSPPKLEDDEEQQDESNQPRNSVSLLRKPRFSCNLHIGNIDVVIKGYWSRDHA